MIKARIDTSEVNKLLADMKKAGADARPLFVFAAGRMKLAIMQNFRQQGAHGDIMQEQPTNTMTKWKPLSDYTIAMRRAKGRKKMSILMDTGILRGSIGTVREISSTRLEFGTNLEYAAIQHFGSQKLLGGPIKPVRAKKLALPMPGVTGKPRDFEGTWFRKGGIYKNQEGTSDPIKLFTLVDEVTIPARPFMTFSADVLKEILEFGATALAKGSWEGKYT